MKTIWCFGREIYIEGEREKRDVYRYSGMRVKRMCVCMVIERVIYIKQSPEQGKTARMGWIGEEGGGDRNVSYDGDNVVQ